MLNSGLSINSIFVDYMHHTNSGENLFFDGQPSKLAPSLREEKSGTRKYIRTASKDFIEVDDHCEFMAVLIVLSKTI